MYSHFTVHCHIVSRQRYLTFIIRIPKRHTALPEMKQAAFYIQSMRMIIIFIQIYVQ